MAIYHCSIKTVSRSAGRSVTAAAAYRAAEKIKDERTGEVHDYTKKKGVVFSGLILPPGIKMDRSELWNLAEETEKRKNSTVAREYEIALPAELTAEERKALALEFAQGLVKKYGVGADVCIHEPGKDGDNRNHHAHILTTTRALTPDGLGKKTRQLDDRKTGEVEKVRKLWADVANEKLIAQGFEPISEKSLADQGLKREPTIHLGPRVSAMERKGKKTDRGQEQKEIEMANKKRKELLGLEEERRAITRGQGLYAGMKAQKKKEAEEKKREEERQRQKRLEEKQRQEKEEAEKRARQAREQAKQKQDKDKQEDKEENMPAPRPTFRMR